jgi:hypothetical protein
LVKSSGVFSFLGRDFRCLSCQARTTAQR